MVVWQFNNLLYRQRNRVHGPAIVNRAPLDACDYACIMRSELRSVSRDSFYGVERMRQLTVRNIDDNIYQRLKDRARVNRRSLEAEVRAILDQAVVPDRSEVARRAAAMRARLRGRYTGNATADIREDRDR